MSNLDAEALPDSVLNPTKAEVSPAETPDRAYVSAADPHTLSHHLNERIRYYDAILSSISDFAYTFDREGRFVFINQALLDLWGLKFEEAVGKNFFDLNYPDDLATRLQRQIQQVFASRGSVTDETEYTSPTGIVGYYEYIFSPYFGPDGTVELVVGTTRNITDRKHAEEKIRRLSERNLEILETITDGFVAIDEDWRISYANKQAENILDREPGDLVGQVLWELLPGLPGSEFESAFRRVAEGKAATVALTAFYSDHRRWYEVNVYPAPKGITIYFKNATERVEADERLARTQEEKARLQRLYQTILSNTPDLAYVFDLDHRFTFANDILLRMWGKTWDEAIGKTCLELGYPDWHAEMHDREIEEVIATRRPIRGEVPFAGTFGRRIYDYIFVPVFGADGEVEAVAGTTRDITERQQMEEALRETDRRKDEFLATLAHELRNPLAPIRSGLQVIRRSDLDQPKFEETLDILERQTKQIVHLVDDLLDISRITQGKIKLKKERIDLKSALDLAVESSRSAIDETQNELTVSVPEQPVFIDADLTRVAQIITNILNNAAKYSPRGGKITLSADEENGEAVLRISDTGRGIPAEMLTNIFALFGQLEVGSEENQGGLGIGLSVVKKLVEMHGGSVEAASEGLGHGSVFLVRLPLAADQSTPGRIDPDGRKIDLRQKALLTPPPAADAPAPEIGPGAWRILIVDDNEDAVDLLRTLLTLEGHQVRTAFEGRAAIEVAREFQPEIGICDLGLPRLSGYELAPILSELVPGIALISLSGWGREEDRQQSQAAGFKHHLVKPVDVDDLLALISQATPAARI